ncbi:AI-2E family transporter [Rhodohalobacter sp.]|uniref:AI-2E family transporter n=1 Tax=Rhodohalobacter sp. TaxID=1974210 RepID=UPI002ACDA2AA|nr:AI-2E family transporter [Rhodohalobacter sp.]MDZ7755794.1 AI-2E family transporter [Rhodohalobacter sp.]
MNKRTFTPSQPYPFWLKATLILFGLCILIVVLSFGKFILMPLAFAAIISMLLNPVVEKFESWKMGRVFSIILVLLLITVVFSGILTLIAVRAVEFSDNLPETTEKLKNSLAEGAVVVEKFSGISQEKQTEYIKNGIESSFEAGGEFLNSLAQATTGTFTFLAFMPIFIFFMLYYKGMYKTFLQKVFERSHNSEIDKVLLRVQHVTQNYLVGLFTVIGIMAVLNSIGLLIVGLDYAIPFAIFASMLAIIPVVGAILGAFPAIIYAFLFYDTLLLPLLVTAVFTVVQLLESSFLTPRIIGSKVSLNPFMAIIVLLMGAKVWGIAGMILSIPLIGIMRVGFSQVDELKPYGYLLGSIVDYSEYEESDKHEHEKAEREEMAVPQNDV